MFYTNVDKEGGGIVDFSNRDDMERAIKNLDDTDLDGSRIELYAENKDGNSGGGRSRSRDRSRSRSRSRSEGK